MGILDKLKSRIREGNETNNQQEYYGPRKRGFMSGVAIGAAGVGKGAAAVGRGSASVLSDPFSWVRKLFGIIKWIVGTAVMLWLLALIIIFIYGLISTGSGEVFLGKGKFILSNIPYSELVFSKGAQIALFVKTGGASYLSKEYGNFETVVDKNSVEKSGLGITITSLNTNKGSYRSGEPIEVFGAIKASSLRERTEVKLNCTSAIQKDDKTIIIGGKTEPDKILVQKERPVFTQIKCSFPKDVFVTDRDIDSATIRLGAIYDFKTEGYLDVWAMSADEKDRYYSLNFRNPLNDFTDANIVNKEDGEVRSVYTYGPMSLAIKSDAQPFSEAGPGYSPYYRFLIKMDKSFDWTGNFVRIQDVYVKLADSFELNTESSSEELNRRFVLDKTEGKYKRYRLSHEERDSKLNNICSDINILDLATLGLLSKEKNANECLRRLSEGFPTIEFLVKVSNLEGPELKKYSGPIVEVYYEFETYKDVFVTIRNPDVSGGGTIV